MLAEVKFERKLNERGEPVYKLLGWSGVRGEDELPSEYFEDKPHFYLTSRDEIMLIGNWGGTGIIGKKKLYKRGSVLLYKEYSELMSFMKRAGERLTKINRRLKKLTKNWKDEEFVVKM